MIIAPIVSVELFSWTSYTYYPKHDICVNEYRDYVENLILDLNNIKTPPTIKKAQNIVGTIAVSSAEAEGVFSNG